MIYICIPTHNEQQTVGVVLWKLRQVLTEFPRDYQLLVADDASTDKTPEVLEPYTRVLPLTVVRCDRRLGQAASLELLLREAIRRSEYPKRDVIITLQADFSEEPDDIVPMIKRIEAGADVVVGNKVAVTRPARMWRLARALGSFFSRAQQWPEGVATPFEGYRAYRLYSVRRAVEDRLGRRLVQYDSWAGHAELLRAVLPHARRVESLDVEDRPDRLQRQRRERPFAAAMQVRPMMRGVAPADLTPVDELDRMAATASRSRDRSSASQRTEPAGANGPERSNGRDRQRTGGNGRERAAQARPERPARAKAASPRSQARPAPAANTNRKDGQSRNKQQNRTERQRRPPKTDARPVADDEQATPQPVPITPPVVAEATTIATPVAETKQKRKRRRKRRGSNGASVPPDGAQQTAPPVETEAASATAEESTPDGERGAGEQGSTRTGENKRRRRRGGRGRRRGARPAVGGAEGTPAETGNEPAPVVIETQTQIESTQ